VPSWADQRGGWRFFHPISSLPLSGEHVYNNLECPAESCVSRTWVPSCQQRLLRLSQGGGCLILKKPQRARTGSGADPVLSWCSFTLGWKLFTCFHQTTERTRVQRLVQDKSERDDSTEMWVDSDAISVKLPFTKSSFPSSPGSRKGGSLNCPENVNA
jgi:hypothetical protein